MTSSRVAMPGFVDGHAHLLMTGAALLKAQLRTADSLDEIRRRLIEWREPNPMAPRVLGISWQFGALPNATPHRGTRSGGIRSSLGERDRQRDAPSDGHQDHRRRHDRWLYRSVARAVHDRHECRADLGYCVTRAPAPRS
jgi:hypothetical protein